MCLDEAGRAAVLSAESTVGLTGALAILSELGAVMTCT
jgi:hypothetical protein